jgi:hypothetical protein
MLGCRYASSESVWEKRYYADMCTLLVEWKAQLELRDGHGQVQLALFAGGCWLRELSDIAVRRRVLAVPLVRDYAQTAVHIAATNGNETVLAALLKAKADPSATKSGAGGASQLPLRTDATSPSHSSSPVQGVKFA